jgi:hypothetical protein
MDGMQVKKFIVDSIDHHFNGLRDLVAQNGGSVKATNAINVIQATLLKAAQNAAVETLPDYELTDRMLKPGIDIAWRKVIVSDTSLNDEWVAALAVGMEKLDEHTCKVVESNHNQLAIKESLGFTTARRLIVFVNCAKRVITVQPVCGIYLETSNGTSAIVPCVFQFGVPHASGQTMVVGHREVNSETLDWLNMMVGVLDSENAAKLHDEHVRSMQVPQEQQQIH